MWAWRVLRSCKPGCFHQNTEKGLAGAVIAGVYVRGRRERWFRARETNQFMHSIPPIIIF